MANGSCATCGKPASAYCPDCVEEKDGKKLPTTYYCSKSCQVADRPKHKVQCKHKIIYRAAEIHQAAFYELREAAYDLKVTSVASNDRYIEIYHNELDSNGIWDKSPLFRFPNKLVTDEDVKKSLLTHGACTDAAALMYELRVKLLKGSTQSISAIQECSIRMQKKHELVRRYLIKLNGKKVLDTRDYQHAVVVVHCKNGPKYVFDASGAQYGQYSPVLMLKDYLQEWAEKNAKPVIEAHGDTSKFYSRAATGALGNVFGPGADMRVVKVQLKVMEVMNAAVERWEKANGKPIHKILTQDHERNKKALLKEMGNHLRDFIARWEASPNKYKDELASSGKRGGTKPKLTLERTPLFETDDAQAAFEKTLASMGLLDDAKQFEKEFYEQAGSKEEQEEYAKWLEGFLARQEAEGTTVLRF